MVTSKSMDFPGAKKSSYAAQVEQTQSSPYQENTLSFLPVPGPQGPQGPPGRDGIDGSVGPEGPQGQIGQKGDTGQKGQDGKTFLPNYGQPPGWAKYISDNSKPTKTGASFGEDGWVSLVLGNVSRETVEKYLPENSKGLYGKETKRINLKGLELGTQLQITYDFEITTYSSNTEVWFRSFFPESKAEVISFVASLKYQYSYDLSVTQNLFLNSDADKISGIVPQVRTDMDSIVILKSIAVSVR